MRSLHRDIKRKVIGSLPGDKRRELKSSNIENKISLGVLIRGVGAVAVANDAFLPEEDDEIREILSSSAKISPKDIPIVLAAIKHSSFGRNGFYDYVRSMNGKISYNDKMSIMENLFRVACADRNISGRESKVIKKVASLLHIPDKDMADVKKRIKGESGCKR